MVKVFLHGVLAEKFGEKWDLDISKPIEAAAAIEANTRSFYKFIFSEAERGVYYGMKVNGVYIDDEKQLQLNYGNLETLDMEPIPEGAAIFSAIAAFAATFIGKMLIMAAVSMAVSLLVTGVVNMMFKPPTPPTPPANIVVESNTSQTTSSYIISGPINNERQGLPVPIGYGRLKVGSIVMSSAVRNISKPKNYLQSTSSNADIGAWSTRGREITDSGAGFAVQGKNTVGLESIQGESYIGPTNGFIDNSTQASIAELRKKSQEIIQYKNAGFDTAARDADFVNLYNSLIGVLRQHPEIPVVVPDHLAGSVLPR